MNDFKKWQYKRGDAFSASNLNGALEQLNKRKKRPSINLPTATVHVSRKEINLLHLHLE